VSCVAGPRGTAPWRERHRPGSDRPTHTRTGVWRRSGLPCFVAPAEAYAVREARGTLQRGGCPLEESVGETTVVVCHAKAAEAARMMRCPIKSG
jgi:hypothetical protein